MMKSLLILIMGVICVLGLLFWGTGLNDYYKGVYIVGIIGMIIFILLTLHYIEEEEE